MTSRAIAVTVAALAAAIAGIAFAIWYTSQRQAEGQVNVLLDTVGAPRRASSSNALPAGVQQAMNQLTQEYVVAANTVPPNPARITEILRLARALKRRYPNVQTGLRDI